jgi:serine protease
MSFRTCGSRHPLRSFLLACAFAIAGAVWVSRIAHASDDADGTLQDQQADWMTMTAEAVPAELSVETIVVDFKDGTTKEQYDAEEKALGVDVEFNSAEGKDDGITIGTVVYRDLERVLALARANPLVERAEPLMHYKASFVPNDPQYAKQWHLDMIHMKDAWEETQGEGVTVAVIDTGIAYEDNGEFKAVPDLRGAKFAAGYDFVNDDEHANDDHGHGTHVAGTIAQVTNNREGVAGVAFKATLMPVKVLDANGSGTSADIADAIRFAADEGAKVINMSLGGGGRSEVMEAAVEYARKKGVVVVCAAGNSGRGIVEYPAAYAGAVAVSAVGPTGELAYYSSYGKELDIAAPGGDKRDGEENGVLQNTIADGNPGESTYAYFQGTSMAAPHVAGVAALLFAAGATTPDEVERALYQGAARAKSEWNEKFGHGLLNAKASLEALKGRPPGERFSWKRLFALLWGLLLWLIVRLTVRPRERAFARPGLGFLAALVVSTLGVFFLPWLGLSGVPGVAVLASPLPDWGNALCCGAKASPLFYSALLPFLLAMFLFRQRGLRGVLAGLAIGFATYFLYRSFTGAPDIALLPVRFLTVPWLVLNAAALLALGRALMRGDGVSSK